MSNITDRMMTILISHIENIPQDKVDEHVEAYLLQAGKEGRINYGKTH